MEITFNSYNDLISTKPKNNEIKLQKAELLDKIY